MAPSTTRCDFSVREENENGEIGGYSEENIREAEEKIEECKKWMRYVLQRNEEESKKKVLRLSLQLERNGEENGMPWRYFSKQKRSMYT